MLAVTRLKRFLRNEQGSVATVAGLLMIPLLVSVGLVLDTGLLVFEHRNARNAADAGALAGAKKVHSGQDTIVVLATNPTSCATPPAPARPAFDAACAIAQDHGYATSEVSVAIPALHPVPTAHKQVEVIVGRPYDTLLMRLVGILQVPIGAIAVAGERTVAPGAGIYALDPDACAGFDWTSSGGLFVFGGGLTVDSSASNTCNPAGGALDKTSTSILCIDKDAGDYDAGLPQYGCDGDGNINAVGGVDCPSGNCSTIQSQPPLNDGPGGGIFSGDPLSGLPGPPHHSVSFDLDDDPTYAGPGHSHAFSFCDRDLDGFIDSALLHVPLLSDTRAAFGVQTDCGGTVLPTSPLLIWNATNPQGYNVCDAPIEADGKRHMKPGIYWGGIYSGSGCNGIALHFDPGIYIMAGQDSNSPANPKPSIDLDFSSSDRPVTSGPILLFVTSDPGASTASYKPPGPVRFQTTSTMSLQASQIPPGSCPAANESFEGVLLFVSRAAPRNESTGGGGDDSNTVTVRGGGDNLILRGVVYDPNGEFQGEGSFRLIDSMLIFNVIDMQMSGDTIIKLSTCGGASNQLFLLR